MSELLERLRFSLRCASMTDTRNGIRVDIQLVEGAIAEIERLQAIVDKSRRFVNGHDLFSRDICQCYDDNEPCSACELWDAFETIEAAEAEKENEDGRGGCG